MGHTTSSQRMLVDRMISEMKSYGKALSEEDQIVLASLLKKPLKKVGAISYASSIHIWAFYLLSIIIEQEKKIQNLENVVNGRVQKWK